MPLNLFICFFLVSSCGFAQASGIIAMDLLKRRSRYVEDFGCIRYLGEYCLSFEKVFVCWIVRNGALRLLFLVIRSAISPATVEACDDRRFQLSASIGERRALRCVATPPFFIREIVPSFGRCLHHPRAIDDSLRFSVAPDHSLK